MTSLEASFFSTLSTRFLAEYISRNFSYFKIFKIRSMFPRTNTRRSSSFSRSENRIKNEFSVLSRKRNSRFVFKSGTIDLESRRMVVAIERVRGRGREGGREGEGENNRGRGMKWRVEKEREEKEPRCLSEQNKLVKPLNDP